MHRSYVCQLALLTATSFNNIITTIHLVLLFSILLLKMSYVFLCILIFLHVICCQSLKYIHFLFLVLQQSMLANSIPPCRNGLSALTKQISLLETLPDDTQDSREERAFRLWINSLGNSAYINNVFEDLRNGWNISWILTTFLIYIMLELFLL